MAGSGPGISGDAGSRTYAVGVLGSPCGNKAGKRRTLPDRGAYRRRLGSKRWKDGEVGQFCVGDGETYNVPVEMAENRYGIMVDEYSLHTDGAVPGNIGEEAARCVPTGP